MLGATNGSDSFPVNEAKAGPSHFPWFALVVRARHEMGVSDHLRSIGYESFLPLYQCRKQWSDRIREVEVPLFPGYLFCQFNPQDRLPILKTPGVIQIVSRNRMPVPVDESEIHAVRTFVTLGVPSQPWPFLEVGDKVRIESGTMRGLEGILIEFKGKHRLVVSITLLQRSVAAEVDSAWVSAVSLSPVPLEQKPHSRFRPVELAV
jgi:transcriptional antiterminator RfaH